MAGEDHLGIAEQFDGLIDVAAPAQRVAHLGAAQGVEVVQGVAHHFGAAECLPLGQVERQLRRRLRFRRVLKSEAHAVDLHLLRRVVDDVGGPHHADRSARRRLAQAGVDMAAHAARQIGAVHEARPAAHGDAGDDVLAGGLLDEPARCHDAYLAALPLLVRQHTGDAAEVIDVTVGEDHGNDRRVTELPPRQRDCRRRGLLARQRVDDDPAARAADPGHVRNVVAAHLKHTLGYLKEAVDIVQLGLPPQTRVDARRRVAGDEVVALRVPDGLAGGVADNDGGIAGELPAFGVCEVLRIGERQPLHGFSIRLLRDRGRRRVAVRIDIRRRVRC